MSLKFDLVCGSKGQENQLS